jgi:hypothetical protein
MAATRSADQFDNIFMELLSENGLSEQEISFLENHTSQFLTFNKRYKGFPPILILVPENKTTVLHPQP